MLSLQEITKVYPGHGRVVDQVSLEVGQGECLVLVGRSGSGKSTILRMVNGLVDPDSGEVRIEGRVWGFDKDPRLRRRIGYVIQQAGLFPHLSVFQNISLLGRLEVWPAEKIHERVFELLDLVNLESGRFAERYPLELSGGEQQRVGLARALFLDPPILLMDEPFGALDPITRRQLQKDFLKLQRRFQTRKTILFVTHDMEEAVLMGNRIAVMDGGKILQVGTPEEIQKNPATDFVDDFFHRVKS